MDIIYGDKSGMVRKILKEEVKDIKFLGSDKNWSEVPAITPSSTTSTIGSQGMTSKTVFGPASIPAATGVRNSNNTPRTSYGYTLNANVCITVLTSLIVFIQV